MENNRYIDILSEREINNSAYFCNGNPIHDRFEKKIKTGYFHHNEQINWGRFELQAETLSIFNITQSLEKSSIIDFISKNKKSLAEYYGYEENEIQILNISSSRYNQTLANLINPNCKMVIGHIGLYQKEHLHFNNLERVWGDICIIDSKDIHLDNLKYVMNEITIINGENISFNLLKELTSNCRLYLSNNIHLDSLEYVGGDLVYGKGNYDISFNNLTELYGNLIVGRISKTGKKTTLAYNERDGFPKLNIVYGNVEILNTYCNLSNLHTIFGTLKIDTRKLDNEPLPQQPKLNLSSLSQIGSSMTYYGNGNNIIGFSSLDFVGGLLKLSCGKNIDLTNLTTAKKVIVESDTCNLPKLKI